MSVEMNPRVASISRVQEKGQALWSGDLQKLQSRCSGHLEARWLVAVGRHSQSGRFDDNGGKCEVGIRT